MNMQEAIAALDSKSDAQARSAIDFLTAYLKKTSKGWRDLVGNLPSKARSNRLDAAISLIDRDNAHESLVAMRKATSILKAEHITWHDVFDQKPRCHDSESDRTSKEDYCYAREDQYYYEAYDDHRYHDDWLRDAVDDFGKWYSERSGKYNEAEREPEPKTPLEMYQDLVDKAYKIHEREYNAILSDKIEFEFNYRKEEHRLMMELKKLQDKADAAREKFDERHEKSNDKLKKSLLDAKTKAQTGEKS